MRRGKKFMAEQIMGKLREAEVGLAQGKTSPEVVRKLGVTEQRYYRWKREYGGVRTDQAKRIVWMASEYGRYGYRRITALLRSEGWWVNHKRVERIWRQECLPRPAMHFSTGVHTLPDPPALGATGYPRVDSTQPQRCTFRPPSAAPFNRRSHTLWFVVLPSLGAHLPGPRKAENEPPRKMARPFD